MEHQLTHVPGFVLKSITYTNWYRSFLCSFSAEMNISSVNNLNGRMGKMIGCETWNVVFKF